MKTQAVLAFLIFCTPEARAQSAESGAFGNVFVGLYQGEGVGPLFSRGYSAFYSFKEDDTLWNSRVGVTYLAGKLSKSGPYTKPYRFFSGLSTVEYALEFCPLRKRWIHYCPFIPSIGLAQRTIGGMVDGNLGLPNPVEGRTSATTLGTVIEMEQKLTVRYVSIGARFQGIFFPTRKVKTVDTFPEDATQEDRRISGKALDRIHSRDSFLNLRIYAGISF